MPTQLKPRFTEWLRPVVVLCLMGAVPTVAWAADAVETRLARIETAISGVVQRSDTLGGRVEPGRGFISERDAVSRFEEHLYEFMVGEYDRAAEGFFALVTTGALLDAGLHRDAEWYLAESLFKMGNFGTAEARFLVIMNEPRHPFHDDSVRRLLELYATSGQTQKFKEAYEREIVNGALEPSDVITYSIGKSFFKAKDFAGAKAQFQGIAPESHLYGKSQYFLGTILVAEGLLDEAKAPFIQATEISIESPEDRQVLDLALLALGRVHYEQGDFIAAADWYGRIGGDSVYHADKLYELVWTFVKQEAWEDAAQAVEIFLLAFPEHEYAAQLQLLEGHLHMKGEVDYDAALGSYERVIADYSPVRERFAALGEEEVAAVEHFKKILEAQRSVQDGYASSAETAELPAFAVAMMTSDPDLSRALTLYRELDRQGESIATSEALITELNTALQSTAGIGGYERTRADIDLLRSLGLQHRLDLLRIEEDWLWSRASGVRDELEALREKRELVRDKALNHDPRSPAYSDTALTSEIGIVQAGFRTIRSRVRDANAADVGARLDTAHDALATADSKLARLYGELGEIESAEVARIKDRLAFETTEVARQKDEMARTRDEAEGVSAALTRAGFDRLEEFFADSVMRADMGIIDVYWAQKLELADKREQMITMKNELVDELEGRFDIIRRKLPASPPSPADSTPEDSTASGGTP